MTRQKRPRVLFIAQQRIQTRAGRKIAVHVWIIRQQPVRNAARRDFCLGIEHSLVVIAVDISPPRLRMPYKRHPRMFLEHGVKALDPQVVGLVLKMHEHRHVERLRHFRHHVNRGRVALHWKLLLAYADRARLEIFLHHLPRSGQIRRFIREIQE